MFFSDGLTGASIVSFFGFDVLLLGCCCYCRPLIALCFWQKVLRGGRYWLVIQKLWSEPAGKVLSVPIDACHETAHPHQDQVRTRVFTYSRKYVHEASSESFHNRQASQIVGVWLDFLTIILYTTESFVLFRAMFSHPYVGSHLGA